MEEIQALLHEHQRALTTAVRDLTAHHQLIVASNRGPVEFTEQESGDFTATRGAGGLVTAMSAMSGYVTPVWVAAAMGPGDRARAAVAEGAPIPYASDGQEFQLCFVEPSDEDYRQYYNVIANPLLWFLQHSMWDAPRTPNITTEVWTAWAAYERVNQLFADAVAAAVQPEQPAVILLQDYHLYLAAGQLRAKLADGAIINLFVHIPWPSSDYWGLLPPAMRSAILRSCCMLDVIGFHTDRYATNFSTPAPSICPTLRLTTGSAVSGSMAAPPRCGSTRSRSICWRSRSRPRPRSMSATTATGCGRGWATRRLSALTAPSRAKTLCAALMPLSSF